MGVRFFFFVGARVKETNKNIWFWGGWVILIESLVLDGVRLKESGNLMADFYCVLCMMYKKKVSELRSTDFLPKEVVAV